MVKLVNKANSKYHIYCGRGSIYGNPLHIDKNKTRDDVCDEYEIYFHDKIKNDEEFKNEIDKLIVIATTSELILGCHCKPKRCHVETIQNYINNAIMKNVVDDF